MDLHLRIIRSAQILAILMSIVIIAWILIVKNRTGNPTAPTFGVSWSARYVRSLGLDPHEAFIALLDDLRVRDIRLAVYWDEIETERGDWQLDETVWALREAEKRGAHLTLAIGERVFRYPECHLPVWAKTLPDTKREEALARYLRVVVGALDGFSAVSRWQIENEPLLVVYGNCPPFNSKSLSREIALIRTLTKKPITTTTSGEFGSWVWEASLADSIGISVYRGAYFGKHNYISYPLTPAYYRLRAQTVSGGSKHVEISELQMEPWADRPLVDYPLKDQLKQMNAKKFKDNISFAKQTGINNISLWGAEWWFWMKEKQGKPELWEEAKTLWATK